jgi:hypothetical protein
MDHSLGMKPLLVLALVVLLAPAARAISFQVQVEPVVNGSGSLQVSGGAAKAFSLEWQNIGSVSCRARPRLDFYALNGSRLEWVTTVWGQEEPLMAGASADWKLYALLDEGDYTAFPAVYMCWERFALQPVTLSFPNMSQEGSLEIMDAVPDEGALRVTVRSPVAIDSVVLLSDAQPAGWLLGSAEADNVTAGEPRTLSIPYEAVGTGNGSRTPGRGEAAPGGGGGAGCRACRMRGGAAGQEGGPGRWKEVI